MDFIELTAQEARDLQAELNSADANSPGGIRKLRVAIEGDRVKFKINEHTWSPPLGQKGVAY